MRGRPPSERIPSIVITGRKSTFPLFCLTMDIKSELLRFLDNNQTFTR